MAKPTTRISNLTRDEFNAIAKSFDNDTSALAKRLGVGKKSVIFAARRHDIILKNTAHGLTGRKSNRHK